jgi:hypothetical protein
MASLTDPNTTLKRARRDLSNLKELVANLQCGGHRELVFGNQDPTGRVQYELPIPLQDLSADVGVVTGQFRAVLDQLVHALFELRNGQPPPQKIRLQFPICEKRQDFRSRIKPDLGGLDVADIAMIEKAQPYNGGNWLLDLKRLAEEHKHRKLIYLTSTSRVQMRAHIADPTDTAGHHVLPASGVHTPKAMYVNTQIAGPIALNDGSPVVDKLEMLQAEVTSMVDAFKPSFN